MISRYHKKRLIRGGLFLAGSCLFTFIAIAAGATQLPEKNWTYLCMLAVVAAAAIVAHFGTGWIMQRIPETPQDSR